MAAGGGPEGLQEMEEDASIRGGREAPAKEVQRWGCLYRVSVFFPTIILNMFSRPQSFFYKMGG